MSLKSIAAKVGIAAAILVGTALPALAVDAYATSNVNVRSCASTDCRVLDVLMRGDRVEIDYCRGSWCAIEKRGVEGWVSASYLARDRYDRDYDRGYDRGYDRYDDDDDYYDRPRFRGKPRHHVIRRYDPGVTACVGGPNARFCISD